MTRIGEQSNASPASSGATSPIRIIIPSLFAAQASQNDLL